MCQLTIVGSGFGREASETSVSVGGLGCDISRASNEMVVCSVPPALTDEAQDAPEYRGERGVRLQWWGSSAMASLPLLVEATADLTAAVIGADGV